MFTMEFVSFIGLNAIIFGIVGFIAKLAKRGK